jgi:hypothetical protein
MRNRDELLLSERCGCFYCGAIFLPEEVKEWVDEEESVGQTALCPRCGIDAIIGSNSGYPITADFLGIMKIHWFQKD